MVLSTWRSFFVAAGENRFSIRQSGDLWAVLATITLRKVRRAAEFHHADKRSVSVEAQPADGSDLTQFLMDHEPGPDEAVAVADLLENLLASLNDTERRIVELRLQGEVLATIAADIGISERTVRRTIERIRVQWIGKHGFEMSRDSATEMSQTREHGDEIGQRTTIAANHDPAFSADIKFEQLVLERMIGAGGMGKVYRARFRKSGSPLAVKFLHRAFQQDSVAVERLIHEANVIRRLNHPGIVRIHGVGRTPSGVWFIAMQLIEGHDLQRAMQSLSLREVLLSVGQVAEAVQHAHNAGVIHCDLKPSNIVINERGSPVLTDFGLARVLSERTDRNSAIAGTAPWMAPEQVDGHFGSIGVRTDIYGLGALLFTVLTGQPPYDGKRTTDILASIASGTPVKPLGELRSDVPDRLSDFCMKCLSRDMAIRPESASDVAEFLQKEAAREDV